MKIEAVKGLLSSFKGATFASMDTVTTVNLLGGKKNLMKGRVTKVCKGHRVVLFTNTNSSGYENMVRRRLASEGKTFDFKAKPLPWGERVKNTPIITNKGNFYLQVIFLESGEVEYQLDGKPIEKEDIEGLPIEKMDTGRQGLEKSNEVIVRTFKIDSIKAIRLLKHEVKSED